MSMFGNLFSRRREGVALLVLLMVAAAAPAWSRNDKNKKKSSAETAASFNFDQFLPQSKVVDQTIGRALGYWQIGDVNSMRKYYADNVVVVSGTWGPPVIGWDNYVKAYQAQRARVSRVRLDRTNTYIKVYGNFAWATYQWVYTATLDNQTAQYRGHTTLVLTKQGTRWVIVLDHSSIVPNAAPAKLAPSAAAAPAKQP